MIGKGYTHIYTGPGKGKTSAALGLAFRASGSGLKSVIIQFMKGLPSGEIEAAARTGGLITIERYGSERFCRPDACDGSLDEHRDHARRGYERAAGLIASGEYRIVILDEIVTACTFGLLAEEDIISLMKGKPDGTELILTGRGATAGLISHADLVTEMREIKHYYQSGVPPRKGIED
ncbi:MAG TPA: cob(I)yrinic acid a,c-diamide adenosyltransferase [Spirochaetota bacterium]|nr:cob(I)yrinic acid a,c-diamide adenosyltransferase [Spirochaetota bacterium]HPG49124.1 cob(I)yrinic acid a,c-diamide adenosyltransferase [Spirochaetota bacterium]HPN11013.1 cob(I)yrinic acid a,c-diamide adenosyltransferase [Spirochaetota bacterium]HQL82034.1 cob(I)yrinic acid a,c-diamide adenosyltransferase [Spirochaetota bacterium]